jgi:hypothetical protein
LLPCSPQPKHLSSYGDDWIIKARNDPSFRAFIIAFQAAVKRGRFALHGVVKPVPRTTATLCHLSVTGAATAAISATATATAATAAISTAAAATAAAAAATAAISTAAAAAATAAISAAAAAATGFLSAGQRLIHVESSAFDLFAIHAGDGSLAFLFRGHLHEPKPLGLTGAPVFYDRNGFNRPECCERLPQVIFGNFVRQIPHIDFHAVLLF